MFIQIILLIIGFIILVKGADLFVEAASSLAENFNVSKMMIALTIVSFGTSAPEFAVSIKSLLANQNDMILGNVIGSNILNILLILGISSCIHPLNVKNNTIKKELPITIMISTLLFIIMNDTLFSTINENNLSRGDGLTILLFFGIFIYYLFTIMRNKKETQSEVPKYNILLSCLLTLLGILSLIIGSNLVVESASKVASILGVSERIIALTIVALGTSLPELVTSVIATKKGEYDIAIGNVVGSNIFNIGIVLGLPIIMFGSINQISLRNMDLAIFLLSPILLFLFSLKKQTITRISGIIFLILFLIYYGSVLWSVL
ncbi:MAG: calcium/sodium antiporter [Bacilli bacterium]|nr:calcium/sodium antiporter [Bacilli bacterium]